MKGMKLFYVNPSASHLCVGIILTHCVTLSQRLRRCCRCHNNNHTVLLFLNSATTIRTIQLVVVTAVKRLAIEKIVHSSLATTCSLIHGLLRWRILLYNHPCSQPLGLHSYRFCCLLFACRLACWSRGPLLDSVDSPSVRGDIDIKPTDQHNRK